MSTKTDRSWQGLVWRTPEGGVVSCVEKLKVLNENFAEIEQLCQDAFEDAVLMGCDEQQVREVFLQLIGNLTNPYEHE